MQCEYTGFCGDQPDRALLFENSKQPVVAPQMTGKSVVPAIPRLPRREKRWNRKEDRRGSRDLAHGALSARACLLGNCTFFHGWRGAAVRGRPKVRRTRKPRGATTRREVCRLWAHAIVATILKNGRPTSAGEILSRSLTPRLRERRMLSREMHAREVRRDDGPRVIRAFYEPRGLSNGGEKRTAAWRPLLPLAAAMIPTTASSAMRE